MALCKIFGINSFFIAFGYDVVFGPFRGNRVNCFICEKVEKTIRRLLGVNVVFHLFLLPFRAGI